MNKSTPYIIALSAIATASIISNTVFASFNADNNSNTTNNSYDITFPGPAKGLMSWSYDLIDQFQDKAVEQGADEMGLSEEAFELGLNASILEEYGNPIPMTKLANEVRKAQQAHNRASQITALDMKHQIRSMIAETFNNGVYGNGSDYDIGYEIMKVESEWACSKAVNTNRLVVFEDFLKGLDDIEECSGYYCYFLRFENEKTPTYEEDDDCILAHLQHLEKALQEGARDSKSYHCQPIGLWGFASSMNKYNELKLGEWMPLQWEGVPLHGGRWHDYAGTLGGLYNSFKNGIGSKDKGDKTDQDNLESLTPATADCVRRWMQDNNGAEMNQEEFDECIAEAEGQTTGGLLYSLSQFGNMLRSALFTWPANQINNINKMLNSSSLNSHSICQENDTLEIFRNIIQSTNTKITGTQLTTEAQKLCQAMLLGDESIDTSAIETESRQHQAYMETLATTTADIESFVSELKNLKDQFHQMASKPTVKTSD